MMGSGSCALIGTGVLAIFAAMPGVAAPAALPSLPGVYDPANDYARAARGELAVPLLYEDRHAVAYLAHNPFTEGHFIVVPKGSTARNFMEIEPAALQHMWAVARKVAAAEMLILGADGFVIRTNAGSAAATAQFHLHVITRKTGVAMDESRPERSITELQALAARIRKGLR